LSEIRQTWDAGLSKLLEPAVSEQYQNRPDCT